MTQGLFFFCILTAFVFLNSNCFFIISDEEGSETASKAPRPLSSTDLIKLAEGGEDLVEDLELSDDDD